MKAAGTDRFKTMGIAHISTHPMEQMLACMDLIMGGTLERFPRLRFAFLEGQCGWLSFWLHRMDEHYEWREPYQPVDEVLSAEKDTSYSTTNEGWHTACGTAARANRLRQRAVNEPGASVDTRSTTLSSITAYQTAGRNSIVSTSSRAAQTRSQDQRPCSRNQ